MRKYITFHSQLLLLVESTIGSLLEKLFKLNIFNINILTSGRLSTSHDKTKLKNDVRVEFFYRERAKLRNYLIQVKLIHNLNLAKYIIESNKIIITTIYLRENVQS